MRRFLSILIVLFAVSAVAQLRRTSFFPRAHTISAGGGGGGTSFSDDFNRADSDSLGANWTEQTGTWDIASNELRCTEGVAYARATAIYSGTGLSTANGYVRITIASSSTGTFYPQIIFRYTSSGSAFYTMELQPAENHAIWGYCASASADSSTIEDQASVTVDVGDVWGITWTGTGASTVVRLWRNPSNTTPSAIDGWDSGGDTADFSFTTDPGTAVNTGSYVGLRSYQGAANNAKFDNLYAGDK